MLYNWRRLWHSLIIGIHGNDRWKLFQPRYMCRTRAFTIILSLGWDCVPACWSLYVPCLSISWLYQSSGFFKDNLLVTGMSSPPQNLPIGWRLIKVFRIWIHSNIRRRAYHQAFLARIKVWWQRARLSILFFQIRRLNACLITRKKRPLIHIELIHEFTLIVFGQSIPILINHTSSRLLAWSKAWWRIANILMVVLKAWNRVTGVNDFILQLIIYHL